MPGPRQDSHVTPEGHMTAEEEDVVVVLLSEHDLTVTVMNPQ